MKISLKWKLRGMTAVCAAIFLIFGLIAWNTVETVKVQGPYYQKIIADKDLLADALPPPLYIIESYLTVLGMLQAPDKSELDRLVQKLKDLRKDYDTRQQFWTKNLANGRLRDLITQVANAPALEFYALCDKEIIPLILADKKQEATGAVQGKLSLLFEKHRKAIDELVELATKDSDQIEMDTSRALKKRILYLSAMTGLGLLLILVIGFLVTQSIASSIKCIIEGLTDSSNLVASASGHVSEASQQLAEAASRQAASVEETSSSLEEMSSMTRQNANNASQAKQLMAGTTGIITQACQSMEMLTSSMADISKASEETSKIIKTIDEIAFQTNLLALNAAVEAARAGEAGAGFAVVADEVRNLAMRAADAARNTASLIESTVQKVKGGSELVEKTDRDFREVSASVVTVSELVGEITSASSEQAQGIQQVNIAVSELDKVIQENAANAEESASASEEMNAQAEHVKEFVRELTVIVGGNTSHAQVHASSVRGAQKNPKSRFKESVPAERTGKKAVRGGVLLVGNSRAASPIPLEGDD